MAWARAPGKGGQRAPLPLPGTVLVSRLRRDTVGPPPG